jgi:tetratricopeptide (TPR) repeat protein
MLLAPVFPASAQTNQQVEWCNGEDNATPEVSIRGCTAVVQSSEHIAPDELAIVFNNRGIAYFKNGQSENAIQDYDRAIRLRSNFVSALISRGFAYLDTQNYGAAIADFDAALKVHPANAASLYGRGLANRARGDPAGANADIAAAQRLDSTIVQELAGWGFNLESQTLPSAAGSASAASVEQSAAPPSEGSRLPPTATSIRTSTPAVEQSAVLPLAGETASSQSAAAPVGTSAPPVESAPPPIEKTASLPPATAPVPTITQPVEQSAAPPAPPEETVSLPLPADVTEALIERGDELLRTGDIVAARSAYERASAGGNRVAATGVAKTYDPVFLAQSGVRGLRGDPARAALWYGKAAAAGGREAQQRLKRLRVQFPQ